MGDERGGLTVFGATVFELMVRRGVTEWSSLSALLGKRGHDFRPSRISNWAHGRHAADKDFPGAVAEVLALNREERARLAEAFAWGP